MRHNVTTPGGFFVGLGGIAAFCAVAAGVACLVGKPSANSELEPQKVALGLVAKSTEKDKQKEIDTLLGKAANEYNGGKTPDLNNLDDLRGVVRFREAHQSNVDSMALLTAKSTVEGKNVLQAAIASVVTEMAAKKPAASAVKVDLIAPAADAPVSMPNFQGGGAKTIIFPTPSLPSATDGTKPAAVLEKPAAKLDSVPGNESSSVAKVSNSEAKLSNSAAKLDSSPALGTSPAAEIVKEAPSGTPATAPAPNRPPLLNGTSSTGSAPQITESSALKTV